ncbi:MAG: hypothetical protein O9329_18225 [Microcystis sp. LE19-12.2C]|jgi:hypothetical protein|nr:hypothetical protein [Microcystis sp. LE19-12.2C]
MLIMPKEHRRLSSPAIATVSMALLWLVPLTAQAEEPRQHALAPHVERLRTDVLYLTELADLQARLIETAKQDARAVSSEGRRGTSLCNASPVTAICNRLPATIGTNDDD